MRAEKNLDHLKAKGEAKRAKRAAERKARLEQEKREVTIRSAAKSHKHGHRISKVAGGTHSQAARLSKVIGTKAWATVKSYSSLNFQGLSISPKWAPTGKSLRGILESYIRHHFVTWPVPQWAYNAFIDEDYPLREEALWTFRHLTKGISFKKLLAAPNCPFSPLLTNRMIHLVMSSTEPTLWGAIRWAQFKAQRGDMRIHRAWMQTKPASYNQQREAFYSELIGWLCRSSMLAPNMLGPLLDFFDAMWEANPTYSMKGRTPNAVFDAMAQWHKALASEARLNHGLIEYPVMERCERFIYETNTTRVKTVWTISPILNSEDLRKEGRDLSHCVASYSSRILRGTSFIWSLKKGADRQVTIEVNNRRAVVQARGKHQRGPTPQEQSIIKRWARENHLTDHIKWR